MCVDCCRVKIGNPMFLKAIRRLSPQLLNSGANEKLTCPKTRASGGLSRLNVGGTFVSRELWKVTNGIPTMIVSSSRISMATKMGKECGHFRKTADKDRSRINCRIVADRSAIRTLDRGAIHDNNFSNGPKLL